MSLTSTHTRHVHQVQLCAPSQDLIWRGQRLLEDALHTASLPAAETSQLLFIRYLNVGTIHSDQSPMSLSLTLEKQIQQLSAIATPGTHAIAAQAPVVSFPDDLAAYSHFAYSLSRDQPLSAWFWPRLLPAWHPTQSKSETIHLFLSHLATHPLAPFATATVLKQLQQQQTLTAFLAILKPEDGPKLLTQNGWTASSTENTAIELFSFYNAIPPLLLTPWPIEDSRSLWLTAMGLIAEQPALAKSSDLMAIAQRQILLQAAPTHPQTAREDPSHPSAKAVDSEIESLDSNLNPSQTSIKHSPSARVADSSQSPLNKQLPLSTSQTKTVFSGTHTNYAGLMYLLNLLEYLQLPAYLPQYNYPETFPQTLLSYTAQRLGVPVEDPILTTVTPSLPIPPSPLFTAWYSALKTWTRRHTGLTLKSLIHRPGELALTATHLDLTFDLNQVDICIRRAGLDLNPGWLPWFGRVVAFHYEPSREQRSGGTL